MQYTRIATTQRDAFKRAVETEMAKFERQESELRKKDRDERAAALWVRTDTYKLTP